MGLGKNGVDWEGIALHDRVRYIKIRRVLEEELDDNLVNMGDEELERDFMDVVDCESPTLLRVVKDPVADVVSTIGLTCVTSDLFCGNISVSPVPISHSRFDPSNVPNL